MHGATIGILIRIAQKFLNPPFAASPKLTASILKLGTLLEIK